MPNDPLPNDHAPSDPLALAKEDFADLITQISLPDSPVGIDAKYTHAIIITYLRQMTDQLTQIEARLQALERNAP